MFPKIIHFVAPVWGREYVRVFCQTVLPNLLSPKSIGLLHDGFQCKFYIYSDEESAELFESYSAFRKLRSITDVNILFIPTEILKDDSKYNKMTAAHNCGVKNAMQEDAGIIFLNADMIYSDGTFQRVRELINDGFRAIEIEGFRVLKQPVEVILFERYYSSGIISIQSRDLVSLALTYPHQISLSHFIDYEKSQGKNPFHTYWYVGKEGAIAKGSHLYPLYVHPLPSVTAAVAEKSIDWDLVDQACPNGQNQYVVRDSDEIFSIEMSDADYQISPYFPNGYSIFGMWRFVSNHCDPGHRRRLSKTTYIHKSENTKSLQWLLVRLKAEVWASIILHFSFLYVIARRTANIIFWLFRALRFFKSRMNSILSVSVKK